MNDSSILPRHAWQPFTPRGVAAFAVAPLGRLLLVELGVAVFMAAVLIWFLEANWLPVARAAVSRLPQGAEVRGGRLRWTTNTPVRLAENRFLALVVDAKDGGTLGRMADLEIALHDTHFTVASLLGYAQRSYPTSGLRLSLDPSEAIPWWGAWETPILALLAASTILALMVLWGAAATLYCPWVRAFGSLAQRRLGWRASWKLSGAALMPGALVIALGVVAYGALGLDLIRLALFFLLHLVTGWVYLVLSPYFLPKAPAPEASPSNPFVPAGEQARPPRSGEDNPFAPPH
jgi:hypothetical protein